MKLKKPPMVRESDSKSNQAVCSQKKTILCARRKSCWKNFIFDFNGLTHSAHKILFSYFFWTTAPFVHASLTLLSVSGSWKDPRLAKYSFLLWTQFAWSDECFQWSYLRPKGQRLGQMHFKYWSAVKIIECIFIDKFKKKIKIYLHDVSFDFNL